MSEPERRVEGWDAIALFFPYNINTIRRKFAKEMFAAGVIFKSHVGKNKSPMVWTFPSLLKSYISMKQAQEGKF
jgi:hypothetical protein